MKMLLAALAATVLVATPAAAAEGLLEGDPATWRLQNFVPNTVMAFFTGSPCSNGRLSFSTSATVQDKDRFFSMVLTARATGRKMGVYYDTTSCEIYSFYMF